MVTFGSCLGHLRITSRSLPDHIKVASIHLRVFSGAYLCHFRVTLRSHLGCLKVTSASLQGHVWIPSGSLQAPFKIDFDESKCFAPSLISSRPPCDLLATSPRPPCDLPATSLRHTLTLLCHPGPLEKPYDNEKGLHRSLFVAGLLPFP